MLTNTTCYLFLLNIVILSTCTTHKSDKIAFDITAISDNGLLNGVSLDYEFCIPRDSTFILKVKNIDPNVNFYDGSPGRIGCSELQVLCLSNTHQPEFRKVLRKLARQDFIERIDQCFFE